MFCLCHILRRNVACTVDRERKQQSDANASKSISETFFFLYEIVKCVHCADMFIATKMSAACSNQSQTNAHCQVSGRDIFIRY